MGALGGEGTPRGARFHPPPYFFLFCLLRERQRGSNMVAEWGWVVRAL